MKRNRNQKTKKNIIYITLCVFTVVAILFANWQYCNKITIKNEVMNQNQTEIIKQGQNMLETSDRLTYLVRNYVLTGDMTGSASDTCLYCGQKNFVNVFKESLKNEIKLIELKRGEK